MAVILIELFNFLNDTGPGMCTRKSRREDEVPTV